MKVKRLVALIFISYSIASLSAQTYLAYNALASNKKESINIEKEKKASKNITSEKTYNWEFLSAIPGSFDERLVKNTSGHEFGKRVAYLKKLMEKQYITKQNVIPGDPMMRTVVLKPNVYYSTRKLEKYFKQMVKDKSITLDDAAKEMEHILEVALAIVDTEDISSFEISIARNKNNTEKLVGIFNQVKLYNIY